MEHHRHPTAMALTSVFVAAAGATVLTVRAGLALTGYAHLGGDGFHIAHVLWDATWWATWAVAISLLLTCPLQIAISEFSAASFAAADLLLLTMLHLTRFRPLWTVRPLP
jgi:hypothetical protein